MTRRAAALVLAAAVSPALSCSGRAARVVPPGGDAGAPGPGPAPDGPGATPGCEPIRNVTVAVSPAIEANGLSEGASISADGRRVAFASIAGNLLPGAGGNLHHVYVYDRDTGEIVLASRASDGTPGNGLSHCPALAGDGEAVAFMSAASNLVAGDGNDVNDIFVHDLLSGNTVRASVARDGEEANLGGAWCFPVSITADGSRVAFSSRADNLVPDDRNGTYDVFVRDLRAATTERVSLSPDGDEFARDAFHAAMSDDGRHVAFDADCDVFVRDRVLGVTERIADGDARGDCFERPRISAGGRRVAFDDVTEWPSLVLLHDRDAGTTLPVSVATDGTPADDYSCSVALSADGSAVLFESRARNLAPVDPRSYLNLFLHRLGGATVQVNVGPDGTPDDGERGWAIAWGDLSADGGSAAFASNGTTLGSVERNGLNDIYVRDFAAGTIERVTRPHPDVPARQPDAGSGQAVLGDTGLAFTSAASNLEAGGGAPGLDVFVYHPARDTLRRVPGSERPLSPALAAQPARVAWISDGGRTGTLVVHDLDRGEDLLRADVVWPTYDRALALNADGTVVAVAAAELDGEAGDGFSQIWTIEIETGVVEAASAGDGGYSSAPSISDDARFVAFTWGPAGGSFGSRSDVFVRDRQEGTTIPVAVAWDGGLGDGLSWDAVISGDGRVVAFASAASNLTRDDGDRLADLFVRDLAAGTTVRLPLGVEVDEWGEWWPLEVTSISRDGARVAFLAPDGVVEGDDNGRPDAFVWDRTTGAVVQVSVAADGTPADLGAEGVWIAPDGRRVALESSATNLTAGLGGVAVPRVFLAPVCLPDAGAAR